MHRLMQIARVSTSLIATFLALITALSAQESTPVFRTTSRLVLLDVVVTDKAGRAVRGLTKEDFTVLEDGVMQPVLSFEASGTAPTAGGPEPRDRADDHPS